MISIFCSGSLVKPITTESINERPSDYLWYDVETMQRNITSTKVEIKKAVSIVVAANIDTIPVYQRSNSIIARKVRLRRSN